jgi:serine/threonine protein kinase
MEPERWVQIKQIVGVCLDMDPDRQGAYLREACGDDSALLTEIRSLLSSHANLGDFLLEPLVAQPSDEVLTGHRFGAYEIREVIGEGGMGVVYRAVRAADFEKQVAIKVVKRGMDTSFLLQRFRQERQILARFDHPNIADVLDGGATTDGRPYFVMEYVEGRSITEYCEQRRLAIVCRLRMFRQVCSAVQYAHQNLVVHRDIKPSNILVTNSGIPKLLDFGIAKLLEPAADSSIASQRPMTPECASPEQVRGEPVTTASDVYSLGVLLYNLISGEPPYRFVTRSAEEIIRVVCEADPNKPSAVRPVSRELDNIVLKAMHKNPARRYVSAEQLSEDIERHLTGQPVQAHPDTFAYRASKFLMRHRALLSAGAAVAATLIIALGLAVREAAIATNRFNDLRSLANSLIFEIHDSIKDLPGSTPARKVIVDRALQYLNRLAEDSRGELALQRELATAYERVGLVQGQYLQSSLGDSEGTLRSYGKALAIRQQIGARSRDWNDQLALAASHRLLAIQQWATGNKRGARESIDRAATISEQLSAARPIEMNVLRELSFDYEVSGDVGYAGDPDAPTKVIESFGKAVAIDEAMLRLKPEDVKAQDGYAIDLSKIGGRLQNSNPVAALPYYQKSLEIEQRIHNNSPQDVRYARYVAVGLGQIGSVYDDLGDYRRAALYDAQGLEMYKQLIRMDPRNTMLQQGLAIAHVNTGLALAKAGDTSAAADYARKASEVMRALVASDPANVERQRKLTEITAAEATVLMRAHRLEAAMKRFDEARAMYEAAFKRGSATTGSSVNAAACREKMAEAAAGIGDLALASRYFRDALAAIEPRIGSTSDDLDALYTAADAYSGMGDIRATDARGSRHAEARRSAWTEARAWYVRSLGVWQRIEHPNHNAPNGLEAGDPAAVAKNLKLCDSALSGSR